MSAEKQEPDKGVINDSDGVARERLYQLGRSRAGFASTVTRKFGVLMQSINSRCTIPILKKQHEDLVTAFGKFEEAHVKFAELAAQVDPEKLERARKQSKDVEALLENAVRELDEYIDHGAIIKEESKEPEDVRPDDSISEKGSDTSTTSKALLKAAAKTAALKVKFEHSKHQSELEYEQMKLNWRRREADFQADIAAAAAEEEVLAGHVVGAPSISENFLHPKHEKRSSTLNPLASPWRMEYRPQLYSTPVQYSDTIQPMPTMPTYQDQSMYAQSILMQRQMLDLLSLPKGKLMMFDGNPMNFWNFISAFDNCVGNTAVDDGAKLNRLLEYCQGKAADIISPCTLMPPAEGYQRARRLLHDRFGNAFRIAEAWVKKITEGPAIKPNGSEGIQDLADDVRACLETLKAMGKMSEIDSRTRMVKVAERLPFYLQGRWRKIAVDTVDATGSYPYMEDLSQFLDKAARESNDPIFGSIGMSEKKEKKPNGSNNRSAPRNTSLSVQATSTMPTGKLWTTKCYHCNGNHPLIDCTDCAGMTSHDRLQFVRMKSLCYNCLNGRTHKAYICNKSSNCTCGRKHSKLLHEALMTRPRDIENLTEADPGSDEPAERAEVRSCASVTSGRIALPFVAVAVKGANGQMIQTYALLDPGSDACFCSVNLIKRLGIKGVPSELQLATLTAGKVTEAAEVSLEVSGIHRNAKSLWLPKVFAVASFPALRNGLPRSNDFGKWKHLKDLPIAKDEDDVMLLIGQNVPQALIPQEVRSGLGDEPYAVRTLLGWTLNGPLGDECTCAEVTCNFVQSSDVLLENQVKGFWEIDVGCLVDDQPQLSVADKQVLKVWDRSLTVQNGHFQLEIPFKSDPPGLSNNKDMAVKRLRSLGRRLARNAYLHEKYTKNMNELLVAGYAEHVDQEGPLGWTWYLPHHNVIKKARQIQDRFRLCGRI